MSLSVAAQLQALEAISRLRTDRVLRLWAALPDGTGGWEPCELLIFRGFSSSISHPTAFDPDQPLLPAEARLENAELLVGPLNPALEQRLAGPLPVAAFLDAGAWH